MANNAAYYHWWKNYWTARSAGTASQSYYVRPSGGSYGDEDGTSYDNAWDGFTNIDWGVFNTGDVLYIAGTHNEQLNVGQSNFTIRGDYPSDLGVIDATGLQAGISIVNKSNITINSITASNAISSCLNISDSTEIITNDCTFINSGNQGIQHFLASTATHNNPNCSNNTDDGISAHDSAIVTVNGGTITGNDQGVNNVGSSIVTLNDIVFGSNTTVDAWPTTADAQDSCQQIINRCHLPKGILLDSAKGGKIIITDSYTKIAGTNYESITALRTFFDGGTSANFFDIQSGHTATFNYCVFMGMASGKYAILSRSGSSVSIDNCTFVGASNVGDGIFCANTANGLTVNNTILTGLNYGLRRTQGTCVANNCCDYNNTNGLFGTITKNDIVTGDPKLINVASDDFGLDTGSSCIGTGKTLTESTGIDTADWTTPIITTKEQIAPWDIGAYVS